MITIIKAEETRIEISKNLYELFNRIMCKDAVRYFMNRVHWDKEEDKLVVTDGRQMLAVTVDNDLMLPNNADAFELAKIGKKFYLINLKAEGMFPNYKRTIPDYLEGDYQQIKNGLSNKEFNICGKIGEDSITVFRILESVKSPINLDYLTTVLKFADHFECYADNTGCHPVVMTWKDCLYLFMPMQKD